LYQIKCSARRDNSCPCSFEINPKKAKKEVKKKGIKGMKKFGKKLIKGALGDD